MKTKSPRQPCHGAALTMLSLVLLLTGCFQKLVVWSPDGKTAAVIADGSLFLSDVNGELSPRLINSVASVTWLPDSKRLIVCRTDKLKRWSEIEPRLTRSQLAKVKGWSETARKHLNEGLSWDDALNRVKTREHLDDKEIGVAAIQLRDTQQGHLNTLEQVDLEKLQDLESVFGSLQVFHVNYPNIEAGHIIAQSLMAPVIEMQVSPDGKNIAYVPFKDQSELYVVQVEGSADPVEVGEGIASHPDWSPDSQSLVYLRGMNTDPDTDDLTLAVLQSRRVINEEGAIEITEDVVALAGLFHDQNMRVRCLSDGRILFNSSEIRLPMTELEAPSRQQLFAIDPKRQPGVSRLIPAGRIESLPENLGFYEVSPDEKRVAFADDDGRVFVLTLANANVECVQPYDGKELRSIPSWRTSQELCFIQYPDPDREQPQAKPQVALWHVAGEKRVLSEAWPEEARKQLLD